MTDFSFGFSKKKRVYRESPKATTAPAAVTVVYLFLSPFSADFSATVVKC